MSGGGSLLSSRHAESPICPLFGYRTIDLSDTTFAEYEPELVVFLEPTLDWWAPAGSLTKMILAMKADRAAQRKLRQITNGQASVAVRCRKLMVLLIDSREWEKVELFAKAMVLAHLQVAGYVRRLPMQGTRKES